jgi:hypothetical protein
MNMKKFFVIFCTVLLALAIVSCAGKKDFVNFEELNSGAVLRRGDTTYTFLGALPEASLTGEQYGIINGEDNHKVFLVNGYSPDEWIVAYLDVIMSVHNLYKADGVTEIPDELQTERNDGAVTGITSISLLPKVTNRAPDLPPNYAPPLMMPGIDSITPPEKAPARLAPAPGVEKEKPADATNKSVVFEKVEMYRYPGGHPYIHEIVTNNANKTIAGYQRGMLVFDKDGNPLKIDWNPLDMFQDDERTFFALYEADDENMLHGKTYGMDDPTRGDSKTLNDGGWSLNLTGEDTAVEKIAYVLYCYKQITFKDGTVWENPGYKNWRETYEGKEIDVKVLQGYYPYMQTISLNG